MRRIENEFAKDLAMAAGIGAVAGLRSMTAPASIALAMNRGRLRVPRGKFELLEGKSAAVILGSLAFGEMIADKFPGVPNRTSAPALTARVVTGGLAGAALLASRKRPILAGAVLGAFGAVAASFLGFFARKQLTERFHTKDAAVAVVEDAIAIGTGYLLVA